MSDQSAPSNTAWNGTNDTPESVVAGQRFNLEYLRSLLG